MAAWMLLSDCFDRRDGTAGIAFIGTLCQNGGVGLSYYTTTDEEFAVTIAHEAGHILNAQHVRTGIMAARSGPQVKIRGEARFSDGSARTIW